MTFDFYKKEIDDMYRRSTNGHTSILDYEINMFLELVPEGGKKETGATIQKLKK